MAEFFEKKNNNKKTPNFGPLCRNLNLSLKLNCISFCRLKILSHIPKEFETSNVEILRKLVNRQTYGMTIHALDDPCAIYGIVPRGSYLSTLKIVPPLYLLFQILAHPPCKKERILKIYEIIKLLQYNHHHMNSITDTHFSNLWFEELKT